MQRFKIALNDQPWTVFNNTLLFNLLSNYNDIKKSFCLYFIHVSNKEILPNKNHRGYKVWKKKRQANILSATMIKLYTKFSTQQFTPLLLFFFLEKKNNPKSIIKIMI